MPADSAVVVALVAALAAIIGHLLNQYATYRLKVKEFRVAQIKSRIDALEAAGVPVGPETTSRETVDELKKGLEIVKEGIWYRVGAVEKQYNKYKWLFAERYGKEVEALLEEFTTLSGAFVVATQSPQSNQNNQLQNDFLKLFEISTKVRTVYENARLDTIRELYARLKREVGI